MGEKKGYGVLCDQFAEEGVQRLARLLPQHIDLASCHQDGFLRRERTRERPTSGTSLRNRGSQKEWQRSFMESLSAATSSTMTSAYRSHPSIESYHGHHVLHRHLVFVVAYSSRLSSLLTRCVIQNEGVIGLGVVGSQFALLCDGWNVLYKVFVSDGFQDRSFSALGYTDENRCAHSHNPPLAQFGWTHAYGEKREENDGGKTGWTVSSQRVGVRLFDHPCRSSCEMTQIRHVRVQQAHTHKPRTPINH